MNEDGEWLRARGIGRERLASYLADYLAGLGYAVDRSEEGEPAASVVAAELRRQNPAVPDALRHVRLTFSPTSGGAAARWVEPTELPSAQKAPVDRFVRELLLHLERTVRTESHGTAKVQALPNGRLPWTAGNGGAPPSSSASL